MASMQNLGVAAIFLLINMENMFRNCIILVLTFAGFAFGQQANPWSEDYEFLKKSLAEGYANLEWAKIDRQIDIVSLDKQTQESIAKATSASEAKQILQRFINTFKDPHLRLRETSATSANNETPSFSTDSSGNKVCSLLGYRNGSKKFSLPFENSSDFKLIGAEKDLFPMGLLKLKNGKQFGVFRIALFSPNNYAENCEETWEEFRKTLTTPCQTECLDTFSELVVNRLLAKLSEQLVALQENKVEGLIVDIGGNGGGSNWVEPVARMISPKPLQASKLGFVRHPNWVRILENRLKLVNEDLLRKDLTKKQKEYLESAKKQLEQLIKEAGSPCDKSDFWSTNESQTTCSRLNTDPLFASGIFPHLAIADIQNLKSKIVLFSPSEYIYQESVFKGKVIVLVDINTASSAEYFAALLQDNKSATVIGEKTVGAGCGYVNGGIKYVLPNTKLTIQMPNCVRFRADETNEFKGIEPDSESWSKDDNSQSRLEKLINNLEKF